MRSAFVPSKSYVFPVSSTFKAWVAGTVNVTATWLCYSSIEDGAYCLYCVLFADKSSLRDVQLVHIPYCKCSDTQGFFKTHTKTNGIHKRPIENYESFLRELTGTQEPVNMQVSKPTQKRWERKDRYCSKRTSRLLQIPSRCSRIILKT